MQKSTLKEEQWPELKERLLIHLKKKHRHHEKNLNQWSKNTNTSDMKTYHLYSISSNENDLDEF